MSPQPHRCAPGEWIGPLAWGYDPQDPPDAWFCLDCRDEHYGRCPERPPNPVDDPEFYCHGQRCLDDGCSPLFCRDTDGAVLADVSVRGASSAPVRPNPAPRPSPIQKTEGA